VQERFLTAFFAARSTEFYLSGGTALAGYYLHHRFSDDLDFFTRDADNLPLARPRVESAASAAGVVIERIVPRGELIQYFFSGDPHPHHPLVKAEFLVDTPPYFADPRRFDGVMVDDLLSIAVNKVTIHTRFEPKDYVDLYLILRSGKYRLEELLPLAKEKMVGLDDLIIAARFAKVRDLRDIAKFQASYMVGSVDWDDITAFFESWAIHLRKQLPPRDRE